MRVHLFGDQTADQFAKHLLNIGNGCIPLSQDLQLHQLPCGQMIQTENDLKANVFPDLATNSHNTAWLCERAILAPRNDAVDKINLDLLQLMPGTAESFKSIDTVRDQYPAEFLNSLKPPGMPLHNLVLKNGAPIKGVSH
ncbi:hypothetical protein Pmani_008285 [Petrolisthes manimaculis]|uniref:ATP-dependent DNA helicase n=1 Tax=Petrolisthes manimaculis TaxID=1843537 RepID=A0AAE1UE22_9EUCA|nr:hypothetical protein Pmani_008285 [Petrolisthes manimaculis]